MPRRSALIVPVPEAGAYYTSDLAIPAHVTILVPFVEPALVDETEVKRVVSEFGAFDFVLDRVERFEDGLRWLHPEPSEPFAELTAAVWARWPDHPPYEGVHDEVVPHLTITVPDDPPVPIACRAREVVLLEEEEPGGRWIARLSIPLR
jgi:hypothetical protein